MRPPRMISTQVSSKSFRTEVTRRTWKGTWDPENAASMECGRKCGWEKVLKPFLEYCEVGCGLPPLSVFQMKVQRWSLVNRQAT